MITDPELDMVDAMVKGTFAGLARPFIHLNDAQKLVDELRRLRAAARAHYQDKPDPRVYDEDQRLYAAFGFPTRTFDGAPSEQMSRRDLEIENEQLKARLAVIQTAIRGE